MKELIGALCIAAFLAFCTYVGLRLLNVEESIRSSLASLLFATVPSLHQMLKDRLWKLRISTQPRTTVSFGDFSLPWYVMWTYVALLFMAIMQLSNMAAGLLGADAGIPLSEMYVIFFFSGTIMGVFFSFVFGTWIGVRCAGSNIVGMLVSVFAVASTVIVDRLLSYYILGSETDFVELYGERSIANLTKGIFFGSALLVISAILGYWRGRVTRNKAYLQFLLNRLPRDTQDTVIELVYQEVLLRSDNHVEQQKPDCSVAE